MAQRPKYGDAAPETDSGRPLVSRIPVDSGLIWTWDRCHWKLYEILFPLQLVVDGRPAHPLNDAPREVHDVAEEPMIRAGCVVAGNDQRRGVMGRMHGDEVQVGEDVTNMAPY